MTEPEVAGEYEAATGALIVETLDGGGLAAGDMPAVLVASHGPFTWGPDAGAAVANAIALETVADMAARTFALDARRGPDRRVPARAPLPAQARPRRLLRPAPPMSSPPAVAQVARLRGPGDVVLGAEDVAPAGPGEVLLRVTAVGLCGSDLHWYEEAAIGGDRLSRPLVLGHEFAAEIATGPRSGERVAVEPADPCGACGPCLAGHANLCVAVRFAGHGTTDGALRTVMAWPARLCLAVPDAIPDDEAALLEPLGVALHALDLARLEVGGSAGVYGCGPLGLLLVQLLRLAGATTVVATDRLDHRVAAARELGATHAVRVDPAAADAPDDADAPGAAHAPGAGPPASIEVDVAFEVAGTDDALLDALTAVRPGGRVVVVGIPAEDRTSFPAGLARRKGLSLVVCRRMAAARPRPGDRARRGRTGPDGAARSPTGSRSTGWGRRSRRWRPGVGLKVIVNPTGSGEIARDGSHTRSASTSGPNRRGPCSSTSRDGRELGVAVHPYANGVIDERLPGAGRGRRPRAGLGAPGPERLPRDVPPGGPGADRRDRRRPGGGDRDRDRLHGLHDAADDSATARRCASSTRTGATRTPG